MNHLLQLSCADISSSLAWYRLNGAHCENIFILRELFFPRLVYLHCTSFVFKPACSCSGVLPVYAYMPQINLNIYFCASECSFAFLTHYTRNRHWYHNARPAHLLTRYHVAYLEQNYIMLRIDYSILHDVSVHRGLNEGALDAFLSEVKHIVDKPLS